jgi:hypothetical protein
MLEDPLISRTYDDFRNLYLLLCRKFPNIGIPNLGRSRFMVRSNVASVANDRFIELQQFLQSLFVLPPAISHVSPSKSLIQTITILTHILVQSSLQLLSSHTSRHRNKH